MFTRSDLADLASDESPVSVSTYLTTSVRGADTRARAIRPKKLIAQFSVELSTEGFTPAYPAAFLQPAQALVDAFHSRQLQHVGQAVCLGDREPQVYSIPPPVDEQVVVGQPFQVSALLPLLAADAHAQVLTRTEARS